MRHTQKNDELDTLFASVVSNVPNTRSGGVVIVAVVGAVVLAGASFLALYRRWELNWGATREEIDRIMPGDEIVTRPTFNATRAITIDANPNAIWPWLVQIGFGRAGWYSYDLLDNLGRHSATRILPELQDLEVGDLVPLGPGSDSGLRVRAFEPSRSLLWWDRKSRLTTWAWALDAMPDGRTRLVTRVRARPSWRHPTTALWLVLTEVADFPMMRKCLRGIKCRAELNTAAEASLPRDLAAPAP